jgi:hypothetical protein
MTGQQIFDQVVRGLALQGQRSYGEILVGDDLTAKHSLQGSYCMYRSPEGLKCAVGQILPDWVYDPRMEGMSWCSLYEGRFQKLDEWCEKEGLREHWKLISALQDAHDDKRTWESAEAFTSTFAELADEHRLDLHVLDGLRFGGPLLEEA